MAISVGLSVLGSIIYLVCIGQFAWNYMFTLAAAILALNQTFYAIYDTTSLKELMGKLLDWLKEVLSKKEVADELKEKIEEAKKKEGKK